MQVRLRGGKAKKGGDGIRPIPLVCPVRGWREKGETVFERTPAGIREVMAKTEGGKRFGAPAQVGTGESRENLLL